VSVESKHTAEDRRRAPIMSLPVAVAQQRHSA
jgi:hypothetical protein